MANNRRQFIKGGLLGSAAIASGSLSQSEAATAVTNESGPKSILVLGGTGFIGPHMVREALRRGHSVTLFNRGKSNDELFPDLETIQVATLSKPSDENSPLATIADESIEEVNGETYGPLKALCEKRARRDRCRSARTHRDNYWPTARRLQAPRLLRCGSMSRLLRRQRRIIGSKTGACFRSGTHCPVTGRQHRASAACVPAQQACTTDPYARPFATCWPGGKPCRKSVPAE